MNAQDLLIVLIVCELFEFFWQKGNTFKAFMENLLEVYQKGIIFFISLHPSFFFILFCIFTLGFQSTILYFIAIFKFADIGSKISILSKLLAKEDLGNFTLLFKEDFKISNVLKLVPLLIYGSAFYIFLTF